MYQLSRALDADPPRIDTERFLKVGSTIESALTSQRIRALAREQFLKRALANRILLELAIAPPRPPRKRSDAARVTFAEPPGRRSSTPQR